MLGVLFNLPNLQFNTLLFKLLSVYLIGLLYDDPIRMDAKTL